MTPNRGFWPAALLALPVALAMWWLLWWLAWKTLG
jgi:hypothetical protein